MFDLGLRETIMWYFSHLGNQTLVCALIQGMNDDFLFGTMEPRGRIKLSWK